jgi:hypothetical protein
MTLRRHEGETIGKQSHPLTHGRFQTLRTRMPLMIVD